jgi:hypothetical protein
MVVGQMVVAEGPATFRVSSVPTATTAVLIWQAATGDLPGGTTILNGSGVSPAGVGVITTQSVYASGTGYSLTATPAEAVFSVTSPSLTLNDAGTYLLLCNFKVDYNGATFAAVRLATLKMRRINNTPTDLNSIVLQTAIVTTITFTLDSGILPPQVYTTTNTNDTIQLFGSINVVPTAGSLDISAASIVALKIV